MSLNSYPLDKESENFYWFISAGPNGNIPKGIFLTPADIPAVSNSYNLGLADYINGEWTDENTTNNGDTAVVMATVAAAITDYLDTFPDRRIYVRGNTVAKRRLYQRFASNSFEDINAEYNLYGKEYDDDLFEVFAKGKIYESLLVEAR